MFTKILIANRGEIACRVAATARRMGIRTVAVCSEADAGAKHVAVCDEAVLIGPPPARESYLRGEKIIEVALATGAQAIHPGYGFLSENADFADACAKAGLVFIGPPGAAIRAMGSKSAAKALMEKARVPLVPGYHGEDQDADLLQREADGIAYPVLLKASAGGGGKGMRIVESSADFKAALASCKREALSSFGDERVLVEKYLDRPRHIEIQVFADGHGNCVYLFERDCSVQRRHQKVLEEAPAPDMPEARRRAMGEAAVAAAQAVGYVGAGTVEFIANQDGSFFFMEMNTRLQVEHPVTEMITGLDLVEWQLRVAAGETLPLRQEDLRINGHAIEARIYAENPEKGFLPSIGTLRHLRTPQAVTFELGGVPGLPAAVRIDSGVREGDAISPFYDPMIAKLIVWGRDRSEALARMAQALSEYQIVGLASNIGFLKRLILSAPFSAADLDTGLIERHRATLFPALQPASAATLALAAASLLLAERGAAAHSQGGRAHPQGGAGHAQGDAGQHQNGAGHPHGGARDPWADTRGWRMCGRLQRRIDLSDEEHAYPLDLTYLENGWRMRHAGVDTDIIPDTHAGHGLAIRFGDLAVRGAVVRDGETLHVFCSGEHTTLTWTDPMAHAGEAEAEGGRLTAPMPGKIIAVLVAPGAAVEKGAPLLIMEAMKMEHTISAPLAGVVEAVFFAVGDQVVEGVALLAFVTPAKDA